MLNVKRLSELLAKNADPRLYPNLFLMSPNGTLLAYSKPVDIKELRDQAALISMAWKEHEAGIKQKTEAATGSHGSNSSGSTNTSSLETLTIEFAGNNLIVRAIQPRLLLVLVGGVPPGHNTEFKMIAEAYGDPRYPHERMPTGQDIPVAADGETEPGFTSHLSSSVPDSHMSQMEKDIKIGLLHIQRKKLDAMTQFLRSDFDSRGFVMPDDTTFS